MSFETEKNRVGREPITVVELDLDFCGNTYGVAPCAASIGVTGSVKCFNTRISCQDPENYILSSKTYRFCSQRSNLPVGISMFPAIISDPRISPTKITPGEGLGWRASVSVPLQDFPHHDRSIDPYVSERTYSPEQQGTFFGKLLARNPYYQGRIMRVRTGYITSPWNWDNFESRTYTIDKIDGPDSRGRVTITGKDVLKLADNDRAKAPSPNSGKLSTDVTDAGGSLTLVPAGVGAIEYDTSGTYRIGEEIGTFTRSGDTITLTGRGLHGSVASEHSANDTFQQCLVYDQVNVVDVIYDLLTTFVGIDPSFIPYDNGDLGIDDEWDIEKSRYLSLQNFFNVVSKPRGVKDMIAELSRDGPLDIWWDEKDAEIKLKAFAPSFLNETTGEINENYNLLSDSVRVKEEHGKRISQVWLYWGRDSYVEDEDETQNYRQVYVNASSISTEGEDQYASSRPMIIVSPWIRSEGQAATVAGRLVGRFKDSPKTISFALDAKDSGYWTGQIVDVTTGLSQDLDGSTLTKRVQILQTTEDEPGHRYEYETMTVGFSGRYGFITPNSTGDYSAESEENKQRNGFISPNAGIFASDGEEAYKVI